MQKLDDKGGVSNLYRLVAKSSYNGATCQARFRAYQADAQTAS